MINLARVFGRQHDGHERLRELFVELVREKLRVRGLKLSDRLLELKTMKSNIPKRIQAWVDHTLAKGKAEGKAEALVCLLAERFGTVTPALHKRIHEAKLPTLERWFKRAIVATDLRSVFARPR